MTEGVKYINPTYFPVHDLFVTESQGAIHNHRNEHLVTSDIAIARARRMILAAIEDVAAGRDPAGIARTAKQNDWRDLVALTEEMDENGDPAELCARMEERGIHITEADAPIEAGGMKLA